MTEQEGLFEVPKRYRPAKRPPDSDQWRKHKGRAVTCGRCITNLHHGRPDSDIARAAMVLTRQDGRREYLCRFHAQQIRDGAIE